MKNDQHLLITGAGGWIGSHLSAHLNDLGIPWVAWHRQHMEAGRWPTETIDSVVHLAAIAHQPDGRIQDTEYFRVNRDLAVKTAQLAKAHGVRRFVFVSTVKVMGERSQTRLQEHDLPVPIDAYGQAKLQAESALLTMHAPGKFEVVVLRPPLVWGPGAKANFAKLLRLGMTPLPLPFLNLNAPRSSIFIDDLVNALVHLITSPRVAGKTFFIADTDDRSVADWIRLIRQTQGRGCRLFPAPWDQLRKSFHLLGLGEHFDKLHDRLASPLLVDATSLRQTGWTNVANQQQAMAKTCNQLFGRSARELAR